MFERWNSVLWMWLFPVVLLIGIVLIPVVPDYADHEIAVAAVSEQTWRWFSGHLIAALAFGLSILAVTSVGVRLSRQAHKLPVFAYPATALGAGLYAAGLGADGIGPIAVLRAGASPSLFFDGSGWFVSGVFMAGTLLFAVGLFAMVSQVNQNRLVSGIWRYIIFIAALAFVSVPAIPSGWGLYGVAAAAFGVFGPIAWSLRPAA